MPTFSNGGVLILIAIILILVFLAVRMRCNDDAQNYKETQERKHD